MLTRVRLPAGTTLRRNLRHPQSPLRKTVRQKKTTYWIIYRGTLNCTEGFNGGETSGMSYDATNPPIWHPLLQLLTDLPPLQRTFNFLPREAMRMYGLCCRLVSFVRPSCHVGVCIQTAEDIVKLLSRPGSSIILVFWPRALVPSFKVTPSAGRKIHGGICDFRLESPLSWKRLGS